MSGFAVRVDGTGWHRVNGPEDIDTAIEYYMEDKGVNPPDPKPSPAMLLAFAEAERTERTRLASVQVIALRERIADLQDSDDEEEIEELAQREAQMKAFTDYRKALAKLHTSAGWPTKPTWPISPPNYVSELYRAST